MHKILKNKIESTSGNSEKSSRKLEKYLDIKQNNLGKNWKRQGRNMDVCSRTGRLPTNLIQYLSMGNRVARPTIEISHALTFHRIFSLPAPTRAECTHLQLSIAGKKKPCGYRADLPFRLIEFI